MWGSVNDMKEEKLERKKSKPEYQVLCEILYFEVFNFSFLPDTQYAEEEEKRQKSSSS
jgi:hypothetical protein